MGLAKEKVDITKQKTAPKTPRDPNAVLTVELQGVEAKAGCRLASLHNDADAPSELRLGVLALVKQRQCSLKQLLSEKGEI